MLLPYLISCDHTRSMNERTESRKELLAKAMKGDTVAYYELRTLYLDYEAEDFIPIAKYMADSIKYLPANIDVVQKYFEKYNKYPDDTLDILILTNYDRIELMKYYNKAVGKNLPDIFKYKIKL